MKKTDQLSVSIIGSVVKEEPDGFSQSRSFNGYSELNDFSPSGSVILSSSGKILKLNNACAVILGKERSELLNSDFRSFVAGESCASFNDFLLKSFQRDFKGNLRDQP
ncbi:MAG: hypothetical protein IPF68_03285 [Bacteroidales bacterium]|nr:hypothetical protein [Bacteroidales bacterium]